MKKPFEHFEVKESKTDREEFEKRFGILCQCEDTNGQVLQENTQFWKDGLWSWIQAYKQKAVDETLDQVEKEVIGEDEFEMYQTDGTGVYPDTKEHYANQLRAELRQKLSALRGGKK